MARNVFLRMIVLAFFFFLATEIINEQVDIDVFRIGLEVKRGIFIPIFVPFRMNNFVRYFLKKGMYIDLFVNFSLVNKMVGLSLHFSDPGMRVYLLNADPFIRIKFQQAFQKMFTIV